MRTFSPLFVASSLACLVGCGAPPDTLSDDIAGDEDALVATGGGSGLSSVGATAFRPPLNTKLIAPCGAYVVEAPRADGVRAIRDVTTNLRWVTYPFAKPQSRSDAEAACAARGARLATKTQLATIVGLNGCSATFSSFVGWFAGGWSSTTTARGEFVFVVASGEVATVAPTAQVFDVGYSGACLL